ncbi:putative Stress responsive A/B Barrel Domain [uncultured delta proteobacterium]|uniref:Putative Stress responsive A/B Barrel Domain n=1 Tax=uncultured delta proteobacterium TaxID=34034 RepID=A0A212K4B9_9DELT|nr:putative Stress responsive A/B Barrel Domain [uncultured delta proteobacterium]
MVHHIVIWRLKKTFSDAERAKALEALMREAETLKSIAGVTGFTLTTKIHPRTNLGADLLLHSTHASQADLDTYYDHPLHTSFVERIQPYVDSRDRIDFEA